MTNIMETPFKGIPETILEELNEDAPSPNASIEVKEGNNSFKENMTRKINHCLLFRFLFTLKRQHGG